MAEETNFSDIKPAVSMAPGPSTADMSSVEWVKATIKTYRTPEETMPTNGYGECRFVGATRKAKAKVRTRKRSIHSLFMVVQNESWTKIFVTLTNFVTFVQ